ncbi:MAG: DUF4367 domain-containing protein [Lachnospiraceae bacterium]|nr:DUF4367 domain-containing protein [Lachnospiraceae bacterium]
MFKDNETLLKALSDMYSDKTEEYLNSLSDDDYEYSEKYNRKIRKIVKSQRKPHYKFLSNVLKYGVCAVVSIIVFSGSIITVSAFCKPLHDFIVNIFSDNLKVTVSDIGNAPTEIIEHYEIGNLPEGFDVIFQVSERQLASTSYSNSTNYIYFGQYAKEFYKDIDFDNSEFYLDENNQEYLISELNVGGLGVIWDNGDYVLHINSDLPREELLEICKSVRIEEVN